MKVQKTAKIMIRETLRGKVVLSEWELGYSKTDNAGIEVIGLVSPFKTDEFTHMTYDLDRLLTNGNLMKWEEHGFCFQVGGDYAYEYWTAGVDFIKALTDLGLIGESMDISDAVTLMIKAVGPQGRLQDLREYISRLTLAADTIDESTEIVHMTPEGAYGVTPCCGKTPFELDSRSHMTAISNLVTCKGEGDG